MSEQYGCPDCNYVEYIDKIPIQCPICGHTSMERLHWTKGGDGSHWEGCADVHSDCKIAQLQSRIAELERKRRWIPVSERLPEVEEYACSVSVLVFRNGYTVAEAWYDFEEENWHKSNAIGMLIDGVTHWMPLPEPPDDYVGDSDHEHDDRIL